MYTHTSGVDYEQGSLSLGWGVREKIDFRDGWRTILSLLIWKEICFLSRNFYKECSCLFFYITHVRSVRNGRYAFDAQNMSENMDAFHPLMQIFQTTGNKKLISYLKLGMEVVYTNQ